MPGEADLSTYDFGQSLAECLGDRHDVRSNGVFPSVFDTLVFSDKQPADDLPLSLFLRAPTESAFGPQRCAANVAAREEHIRMRWLTAPDWISDEY